MNITNRHPVRRNWDVPSYFDTKIEGLAFVTNLLEEHDLTIEHEYVGLNGDGGGWTQRLIPLQKEHVICDCCAKKSPEPFDNVLVFNWYKMESGRLEINSYVS